MPESVGDSEACPRWIPNSGRDRSRAYCSSPKDVSQWKPPLGASEGNEGRYHHEYNAAIGWPLLIGYGRFELS